jgi:hypothetical protein
MATWGQLKIQTSKYVEESTLYYDYGTCSHSFHFIFTYRDDDWYGDGMIHEFNEYKSRENGEAQMEAYINHFLADECSGDIGEFVGRYIVNNRFAKARQEKQNGEQEKKN